MEMFAWALTVLSFPCLIHKVEIACRLQLSKYLVESLNRFTAIIKGAAHANLDYYRGF